MTVDRLVAVALAAFGAANAVPLALAQLDFAGYVNVLGIDSGDTPQAVLVMAGVGGVLTWGVITMAFIGAGLALMGSRAAVHVLGAAAVIGFATALVFWIPAGVLIGGAALLLHSAERDDPLAAV